MECGFTSENKNKITINQGGALQENEKTSLILRKIAERFPGIKKKNNKSLQIIISDLSEQQVYFACIYFKALSLMCERLSDIYNLQLGAKEFCREAATLVDQNWDKIKNQIKNEIDAQKLIDSVFGNRTGDEDENKS